MMIVRGIQWMLKLGRRNLRMRMKMKNLMKYLNNANTVIKLAIMSYILLILPHAVSVGRQTTFQKGVESEQRVSKDK